MKSVFANETIIKTIIPKSSLLKTVDDNKSFITETESYKEKLGSTSILFYQENNDIKIDMLDENEKCVGGKFEKIR